jgi:hypothetical protein
MDRDGVDILCYTRLPQDEQIYSAKLAWSMHLAYRDQDGRFQALNHNSGRSVRQGNRERERFPECQVSEESVPV